MSNNLYAIVVIIILLFTISCSGNKNASNDNSTLDTVMCICDIPDEVLYFVGNNVVFAMVVVSADIDHMGNTIYSIDSNLNYQRMINREYPNGDLLFSNKREYFTSKIDDGRYIAFCKYLDSINTDILTLVYKTPDNLSVNGGANTYVYINNGENEKWLCFEPESSDFVDEIERNFNDIFWE